MPQFSYRAKQGPDKVVDGTVEAATLDEAIEKLDGMGLLPVRMDELKAGETAAKEPKRETAKAAAADGTPAAPAASKPLRLRLGGAKSSDITIFGRQLATLIKSGVPILRALYIISDQTESAQLKKMLEHAQEEIRNGSTLSAVLAQYPRYFPPIYIAMVRAGEDSGTLETALMRVSEYRQRQEEILSKVRTAMAYPILMALTGVGTVAFMLTFVIPRMTALFTSMGGNLPLPTRILMVVSAVFQKKIFWAAAAAIIAASVLVLRARAAQAKRLWSAVSLRLPVVKGFVMKSELARFSRTLELLIKSGVSILRAIEITAPVLENTVLREQFSRSYEDVSGGGSLGKSIRESKIFPLFVTNLISVGEESGKLEESLGEIANFYEKETDEAIKIMTSLLEPIMILVMGLVVGFIVIAMMLPMFELSMAVH